MSSKRITGLTERTTLASGDYLMLDNASLGSGKFDAMKLVDEWELINTVTVSQDSASVAINTDQNGMPFKLKKFFARIELKPSTTGANSNMYTKIYYEDTSGTAKNTGTSSVQAQTSNRFIDFIVVNIAGFWVCLSRAGSTFSNTGNIAGASGTQTDVKTFTGFEIYQSSASATLVPKDTVITLYGIRA